MIFVLSSNCSEHVANPLKALQEWIRVLRKGGALILVLPNKYSNFDWRRSVTSFEHIVHDYVVDTSENDLTHLEEILKFHDLSLDPPAGDFLKFKNRSMENYANRTLHHHVFDLSLMTSMVEYLGLRPVKAASSKTDFFLLAFKDH